MSGAAGPGPGLPAGPGRSPLPCAPRPAAVLQLGGGAEPARPGVAVIDLRFPRGAAADVSAASPGVQPGMDTGMVPEGACGGVPVRDGDGGGGYGHGIGRRPGIFPVQEIVFRNFYTAFLSVRVQRPGSRRWVTCLRDYRLMPCPHTEEGSQDYFSLCRQQMLCDVGQVTALRFILRQPSPVWLHFTIEELQIFPPGQKSPQKDFPSWLSQLTPPEQPPSLHGELPDPEKVSTEVQQMWVLTEVIRARQAAARIGRFDVDGCYDVNLLSYT